MRGEPDDLPVRAWWRNADNQREEKIVPLGVLRQKAVKITPGQKISYVTDALYNEENACRISEMSTGAELMFIEAPFLHAEADSAARKYHLTAMQAGTLARQAGAKRMVPFHFSPKYKKEGDLLREEVMGAFHGAL